MKGWCSGKADKNLTDVGAGRNGAGAKNKNGYRLIGWKAIGQFLGCTERTARRWEADRALPVHRIPGGTRGSVWAHPDELTTWLQALPTDVQATLRAEASTDAAVPTGAGPEAGVSEAPGALPKKAAARRGRRIWLTGGVAAVVLAAAAGVLMWKSGLLPAQPSVRGARLPYSDNPEARETYNTARFEVSERTAESLAAAQRGFQQLVERYPDRAAAWAGLADTYLLLREFGSMSDAVAYPQAERLSRTALALDPNLADAWLDQAFVAWWWRGDGTVAFHDFDTALRLDPGSARAHHWYATALFANGNYPRALDMIARARAIEPNNRAIVADEAWIRFGVGQRAQGLATLERLAQLDPQFVSWHYYLAHAYLIEGRDADFLREAGIAAELRGRPETVAALKSAAQRFQEGGRGAMLDQLASDEATRWARGTGSAVVVAEYHALASDRAGMLRWLDIAQQRHDHNLSIIRGYPEFTAYANDPDYRRIVEGLPWTDRVAAGQ